MRKLEYSTGIAFSQYDRHPEYKSLAPNGQPCQPDTAGLLRHYPVAASDFRLIGKETERGWEDAEDISTLLPSLLRYEQSGIASAKLREHLSQIPLHALERETGLSRHTIVRARRAERIHPKKMHMLRLVLHIL